MGRDDFAGLVAGEAFSRHTLDQFGHPGDEVFGHLNGPSRQFRRYVGARVGLIIDYGVEVASEAKKRAKLIIDARVPPDTPMKFRLYSAMES